MYQKELNNVTVKLKLMRASTLLTKRIKVDCLKIFLLYIY